MQLSTMIYYNFFNKTTDGIDHDNSRDNFDLNPTVRVGGNHRKRTLFQTDTNVACNDIRAPYMSWSA